MEDYVNYCSAKLIAVLLFINITILLYLSAGCGEGWGIVIATFSERHNSSRSKVYILLYYRKFNLHLGTGLTVREIHEGSGVSYDYLRSKVSKWVEWKYLLRKIKETKAGPAYAYTIAERGCHFIEDILPAEWQVKYLDEIRAWRKSIKEGKENLIKG